MDRQLRFNVRLATPPRGQACNAGAGSAFVHRLKPGDTVTAIGPFGEFHIKPTQTEMIYLGGGSGMAPLRSHLSHLLETRQSPRRISFWYGARSLHEVFYRDYFEGLERRFPNFSFHLALSEPQPQDHWTSLTGLIPEVLKREHLDSHPCPAQAEYYLCGPPVMIRAALNLLKDLDVPPKQNRLRQVLKAPPRATNSAEPSPLPLRFAIFNSQSAPRIWNQRKPIRVLRVFRGHSSAKSYTIVHYLVMTFPTVPLNSTHGSKPIYTAASRRRIPPSTPRTPHSADSGLWAVDRGPWTPFPPSVPSFPFVPFILFARPPPRPFGLHRVPPNFCFLLSAFLLRPLPFATGYRLPP